MPKRNKQNKTKNRKVVTRVTGIPTAIATKPVMQRVVRYVVVNGAIQVAITAPSLLFAMGFVVSTTTLFGILDSVRLKRISVWNVNAAATTTVNVLDKLRILIQGQNGCVKEFNQYGNPDKLAHLSLTSKNTEPNSSVWWWYNNKSSFTGLQPLALINATQGSIIDLEFEYVLCNITPNTYIATGASFSSNQFVFVPPDYINSGATAAGSQNLVAEDGNSVGTSTVSSISFGAIA
jgi:hypothetical protein